jgi:hypothetical protein
MSDMMPVSLCLATQELFDAKRYMQNFGDFCTLRSRDSETEAAITSIKRELISSQMQAKYLDGHKAAIVSNIDKILSLATGRYASVNIKTAESLLRDGKSMIRKVAAAQSFQDILILEPIFKSKVLLPVYELFTEYNRRASQRAV